MSGVEPVPQQQAVDTDVEMMRGGPIGEQPRMITHLERHIGKFSLVGLDDPMDEYLEGLFTTRRSDNDLR